MDKKYDGIIQGSKTVDATALIGVIGVIEVNFGMLQSLLGQWYGLSYIVMAAAFYYLRRKTTKPLGEK